MYQDDIEPLGSGVVKHWGHIDLLWNFKIAGKVWVLNDNYCVEVQHYWQHNVLEATVIQNSQWLHLWNIVVPRYYCITTVPWPTAPLPIKQLLYIPCIYAWTTVEYIRALTSACIVPAGFCFLLPCFKAKAASQKTIERHQRKSWSTRNKVSLHPALPWDGTCWFEKGFGESFLKEDCGVKTTCTSFYNLAY